MFMRFARTGAVLTVMVATVLLPQLASAQQVLSVSTSSVSAQTYQGQNAPSQTVQVRNAGKRALKWSVATPSASWVRVSPTSGTNGGTLTVTLVTSALPVGVQEASFRIDSNGGSSIVAVSVTVVAGQPALPPALTVSCPGNQSVTSSNGSAVAVTYSATASGGVAPVTVTGTPASGSSFPVGTTPVTVTARSSDGQTSSCGFSVTVTYTPPPPPAPPPPSSAVGPQSTITCPTGAVDLWPGVDIQTMVNSYPGNTTFCVRAGTHTLRNSITPKSGDTFVGEYGAVLDGTGWSSSDDTQAAFRAHNQDIDYVTVRNLVIRNMPMRGIHAFYYQSNNWTVEYNEIGPNRNIGIVFPSGSLIRNNFIHHNAYSGYMGVYAHNSTLEGNEIANNGTEQKVSESANVTFRNNFVHHNAGGGIWYDSNNTGLLVEGNRVEDNRYSGIWLEISSGGVVRNNAVRRSGDAGVFVSTSKNMQVYGNTLEDNYRAITYFVNCPSVGGGTVNFDLANNSAYDNTVTVSTQSGAFANGFSYASCTATQVTAYQDGSKNLSFSRNTYRVPSLAGWYWLWNGTKSWATWQSLGQDVEGSVVQR